MPESIDFDTMALQIVESLMERAGQDLVKPDGRSKARAQNEVLAQLRQVWNARGRADLDAFAQQVTDDGDRIELVESTGRAIRSLDR